MILVQLIDYLRDRLKYVIRVCYVLLAGVAVWGSLVAFDSHHAHTAMEKWPFFWSIFGFLACAIIIVVSKWYGHSGVMTREDYYDD